MSSAGRDEINYETKASKFPQPWSVVPCTKGRVKGMVITDSGSRTVPEDAIMERLHDQDHLIAALTRENRELREALDNLSGPFEPIRGQNELWSDWQRRVSFWKQARAALAKKGATCPK